MLKITNITATSAAGVGREALSDSIREGVSGLTQQPFFGENNASTFVGIVDDVERVKLPNSLSDYTCRNNCLAYLGLQQDGFIDKALKLVGDYGPSNVGVFIGTSTSGIEATEFAYRGLSASGQLPEWYKYSTTHNNYSVAKFIASIFKTSGPCYTLSTACSSSAKVFAAAQRAIASGLCKAAIIGGVDTLCMTTLYGFRSLQLVSDSYCKPCDCSRSGLSIGEAAGFATLEAGSVSCQMTLAGFGESSDAHHMSSPPPDGRGAKQAMRRALISANLAPTQIDYINMHGTGTKVNDSAESHAIVDVFGVDVPVSSTKGWTGHTLGAAGIVEAAICFLVFRDGLLPATLNCNNVDTTIVANVLTRNLQMPGVNHIMSNSFGFGGSNASLVFGRGDA